MSVDYICREVKRLKKKYHESDPFKLCDAMGIILLDAPMGNYQGACKGFFLTQSRKRSITINSDLPEELQRIIVTHELGHAVLHAKAAGVNAFHDFELFDSTSIMEYEANIFAADFLMDDDDGISLESAVSSDLIDMYEVFGYLEDEMEGEPFYFFDGGSLQYTLDDYNVFVSHAEWDGDDFPDAIYFYPHGITIDEVKNNL